MKLGHWVILGSVLAFIITVYVTMFRSVPVITTQLVSTAKMFTSTAPPRAAGFNPEDLKDVQLIDPFKTKKMKMEYSEFSCATPVPVSLPLKLLSTSVLSDKTKSLAVLSSPGRGAFDVREGQEVGNNLTVYQINRMQVLLRNSNNNGCEVISLILP